MIVIRLSDSLYCVKWYLFSTIWIRKKCWLPISHKIFILTYSYLATFYRWLTYLYVRLFIYQLMSDLMSWANLTFWVVFLRSSIFCTIFYRALTHSSLLISVAVTSLAVVPFSYFQILQSFSLAGSMLVTTETIATSSIIYRMIFLMILVIIELRIKVVYSVVSMYL